MPQEFEWPIRVYYEDTDAGGVVYHANYLRFYERARSEWLNHLQINHTQMLDGGVAFVVTHADIEYLKPALLNQCLVITSQIKKVTAARVIFEQQLWLQTEEAEKLNNHGNRELLNRAVIKVACLKLKTFSPCRIPAIVKEEFQRVS